MKRLLFGIFCMLFCGVCNSAQIVNVEYIHKLIEQQYGITVPYNSELTNPHVAANMKYLLTTIDAANSILNGERITDYGNGEYATNVATDTVAALEMVRDHVRDYKFFATTTPDTTSFSFSISASGVFHIDWGDGTRQSYRKNNTTATTYSHEYADAGEYVIKIGGYATGYSTGWAQYTISFKSNLNLAKIEGSLGAIFPTLKTGTTKQLQSNFNELFSGCTNLTGAIPPDLFKGVYGEPAILMFTSLFANTAVTGEIPAGLFADISGMSAHIFYASFMNCDGLTGSIPENLFSNISGKPSSWGFFDTFSGCSGLTGSIPENLFAGISGPPANRIFARTFKGCSGLTGSIPANLFAGIVGPPVGEMFMQTFSGCSGLTGEIPENLFAGISGPPATDMFSSAFADCSGLTGPIPAGLFAGISGPPAQNMFVLTFYNCTGLTEIPAGLFAGISGPPAQNMFSQTFRGCSGINKPLPNDLFAGISGVPASHMYYYTFGGCSKLPGPIPDKLFGDIYGAPASSMYTYTFYGCGNLNSEIPENLFGNLYGDSAGTSMFQQTFYWGVPIYGDSAKINGQYLYEIWPDAGYHTYGGCTKLTDYADIPSNWK